MGELDPLEMRRRFHAARALAAPTEAELAERERGPKPKKIERGPGITVPELAQRLAPQWKIGAGTLGRVERGVRQLQPAELLAIANACGLPYEFFTTPLNGVALRDEIRDRLDRIEAQLEERAAKPPAAGAPPEPPGELGRRIREQTPNGQPQEQPAKPEAADGERGAGG